MKKTKKQKFKLILNKTIISSLKQSKIKGGCPSIGCTGTCVSCHTCQNKNECTVLFEVEEG